MLRSAPFLLALLLAPLAPAAEPGLLLTVQDAKGAPVADAVVSLHSLEQSAPALPPSDASVEIVQRDQEYIPYVTVVRVGTRVDFPNQDDIQHHIYSVSKAKRFEKPLYAPGARESVLFDQPGVVTIGCNIHDWMVAYLVVLPTPHFAQTDAAGTATLRAPAGRYRLELWHPRLAKPLQEELALSGGDEPRRYTLALKPDRRIRRAPEAKAGGY